MAEGTPPPGCLGDDWGTGNQIEIHQEYKEGLLNQINCIYDKIPTYSRKAIWI